MKKKIAEEPEVVRKKTNEPFAPKTEDVFILSFGELSDLPMETLEKIGMLYDILEDDIPKTQKITGKYWARVLVEAQTQYYRKNKCTPPGVRQIVGDFKKINGTVFADLSYTVNIGDFNNLKISGGINVPFHTQPSDIREGIKTWHESIELLKEALTEEMENARSGHPKTKK